MSPQRKAERALLDAAVDYNDGEAGVAAVTKAALDYARALGWRPPEAASYPLPSSGPGASGGWDARDCDRNVPETR